VKAHLGQRSSPARAVSQRREDTVVARLSTLAPRLDGEPDPAWQATTRARLVAMAAVRTPEPAPVSPLRRLLAPREGRRSAWRTRLTAGMAGAAAAVTGLATVVALSADALPGDALYGVKRGTEQTQLVLAGDARGMALLGLASTRLDELGALLDEDPGADMVRDTLATMDQQTLEGAAWLAGRAVETGEDAPLDDLDGWTDGQSGSLGGLLPELPIAAQERAGDSVELLTRIDARVSALRVALDCAAGPAVSGTDELGPVPRECEPETPVPPLAGGDLGTAVTDEPEATPRTTATPSAPGTHEGDPDAGGSGSRSQSPESSIPTFPSSTPTFPIPVPVPDLTPGLPVQPMDDLLSGTHSPQPPVPEYSPSTTDLGMCLPLPLLLDC
jgi:hypothetical protein